MDNLSADKADFSNHTHNDFDLQYFSCLHTAQNSGQLSAPVE